MISVWIQSSAVRDFRTGWLIFGEHEEYEGIRHLWRGWKLDAIVAVSSRSQDK